jgi:ABC-type amino acid transport substrate-binding protein
MLQGYGFAAPQHSSMSDRVNIGLLELAENGTLTRLVARWLPE